MADIRDVNTMRTIFSIQMVYMVCAPSMVMLAEGEAKFMFSIKIDYKDLWHKISPWTIASSSVRLNVGLKKQMFILQKMTVNWVLSNCLKEMVFTCKCSCWVQQLLADDQRVSGAMAKKALFYLNRLSLKCPHEWVSQFLISICHVLNIIHFR